MRDFSMPTVISSRDNPQIKALRRLIAEPRVRRAEGRCWVEGPRMVSAALARSAACGWVPELLCLAVIVLGFKGMAPDDALIEKRRI